MCDPKKSTRAHGFEKDLGVGGFGLGSRPFVTYSFKGYTSCLGDRNQLRMLQALGHRQILHCTKDLQVTGLLAHSILWAKQDCTHEP